MSSDSLITLKVVPNFYQGHTYLWEVDTAFMEPMPWTFQIEQADVPYTSTMEIPEDPQWKLISTSMTNVFAWVADQAPVYTKDYAINYRVKMTAGGKTFYSRPHTIFADIDRDSWMVIREIQRKELMHMRLMAGVPCQLYQRKQTGIPCTHCLSPDTGEVLNPNCAWCLGTGKLGGYHGPYPSWGKFDVIIRKRTYGETDIGVMTDVRIATLRFIGNPHIFQKDIVADISSQRRYTVDKVEPIMEIRRIPVIQTLYVSEVSAQDIAHKLGTNTPIGEEKC